MAEQKTIEEYLSELRTINQQLQSNDVRMDDAFRLYEKGATLAREANALLDSYQDALDEIETGSLPVEKP